MCTSCDYLQYHLLRLLRILPNLPTSKSVCTRDILPNKVAVHRRAQTGAKTSTKNRSSAHFLCPCLEGFNGGSSFCPWTSPLYRATNVTYCSRLWCAPSANWIFGAQQEHVGTWNCSRTPRKGGRIIQQFQQGSSAPTYAVQRSAAAIFPSVRPSLIWVCVEQCACLTNNPPRHLHRSRDRQTTTSKVGRVDYSRYRYATAEVSHEVAVGQNNTLRRGARSCGEEGRNILAAASLGTGCVIVM